ncbi:MAG: MarR family transcriptional regulator [Pirellulales bacterium]|nr:MarR family transcriptional regulator [Pirellulales bacterium]
MRETSDSRLIELLRLTGPQSISQIAAETEVTATAVRQRLSRLMRQGLVERRAIRDGRGRPRHEYALTSQARRQVGDNFADLAMVLWGEIRAVKDSETRRGLLERIAGALASEYAGRIEGATVAERMRDVQTVLTERRVPSSVVEGPPGRASLTVLDCPYPALAEQDRGICAVERMLFSRLAGAGLQLSQCRLDGHACCQFETN